MASYVCFSCGEKIEVKNLMGDIFCPKCSCRIVFKEPPSASKEVKCD